MKIPRIEYRLIHPVGEKLFILDLNICKDINIIIYNPIKIDKKDIDKYNSSSDYYNDICYPYTTENGTDIIIKDRREEYINNDLKACEENCNFTDYDFENQKAKCSCKIIHYLKKFSDININKTLLKESFTNIDNFMNLNVMKCYKKLFCKKGLLYNIGSYILLLNIIHHLTTIIIFYAKDYKIIQITIENITNKIKEKSFGGKIKKKGSTIIRKSFFKKKKQRHIFNKLKIESSNTNKKIKEEPPIKKAKSLKKKIKNYYNNINKANNSLSRNISKDSSDKSIIVKNYNYKKDENSILNYNIYELNNLEYLEALKKDKRNYCEYYLSLLKSKHILFSYFCKINDYNSPIIKIFLFFYSFVLNYFINTLFFNDSTMHKIYKDFGVYNFFYQIPQILLSLLISTILNVIAKTLSLTESNILKFKNKRKDIENKKKELIKLIIYKYILFFIISFCLLLFFWYYISCFCVIYINTQTHLIKDTIIGFVLSMIYPFGIYLLPGLFRIPALRAPNKDKKKLYLFSKIIQLL